MKISDHLPSADKPKDTVMIQARVSPKLARDLKAKLFKSNLTMVDFVTAAIKAYLDEK